MNDIPTFRTCDIDQFTRFRRRAVGGMTSLYEVPMQVSSFTYVWGARACRTRGLESGISSNANVWTAETVLRLHLVADNIIVRLKT